MSTLELKNKVIDQINSADKHLLQEILHLIEFEKDDLIYQTNSFERSAILEGQEQIKSGNHFSNEEVDNEISQWLEK